MDLQITLKFLYELIGVRGRYRTNQAKLRRSKSLLQITTDVIKISTKITKNFKRIQNLTDDLFCTGEIQTNDYCLEVYRQYIENEDFGPFLYNALEINLTLRSLKPELEDFNENLEKLFIQLFKLLKYNGVFINDLYKLEKTFFKDLKNNLLN